MCMINQSIAASAVLLPVANSPLTQRIRGKPISMSCATKPSLTSGSSAAVLGRKVEGQSQTASAGKSSWNQHKP